MKRAIQQCRQGQCSHGGKRKMTSQDSANNALSPSEIEQMTVADLKNRALEVSNWSKYGIKKDGPPRPELNIVQIQTKCKSQKAITRKFDKSLYEEAPWLCGCGEKNAFFCFVCLLFGGDDNWTKDGINDLKHLSEMIKTHEHTPKHKNNLVSFHYLGRINVATTRLSEAYVRNFRIHNERVPKNLQVLSKIINILKLSGTWNDEENLFMKLVDLTKNYDAVLVNHLQEPDVFKDLSEITQNDILDCMLEVCREQILCEIKQSSFLAVMAVDTTDDVLKTALVLRYELHGNVYERFWGFVSPESQDADADLLKYILEQLDRLLKSSPGKLIAQTYNNTVMSEHVAGVKKVYKNAHFIQCYLNCTRYQFNEFLEKNTASIPSARLFFINLNRILEFFSTLQDGTRIIDAAAWYCPQSVKAMQDRRAALNQVCNENILDGMFCQTIALETMSKYFDEFLECFQKIQSGVPKLYNAQTTLQAATFLKWFHDDTFKFWLNLFNKIVPHLDVLFNQIRHIPTDATKNQQAVDNFEKAVCEIRDSLSSDVDEGNRDTKNAENLNLTSRKVCDTITFQIKKRFRFKNHLAGAKLFMLENYDSYRVELPVEDIEIFCEAFPMIDEDVLKVELGVFYSRQENEPELGLMYARPSKIVERDHINGCLKTLNLIISLGLDSTAYKEIAKVLRILVTIPMDTSEQDLHFSTLDMINTFSRNNTGQDSSNDALAMLSIGKEMVRNMEGFNDKVVKKFINYKFKRSKFHFENIME